MIEDAESRIWREGRKKIREISEGGVEKAVDGEKESDGTNDRAPLQDPDLTVLLIPLRTFNRHSLGTQ